jgi:hypothetical protein
LLKFVKNNWRLPAHIASGFKPIIYQAVIHAIHQLIISLCLGSAVIPAIPQLILFPYLGSADIHTSHQLFISIYLGSADIADYSSADHL